MIVKPQADVFGASDSGPFYKEDGPRFESYAGGVTWARGKGYSFVASDGLPGSKSENDELRAIVDSLADSTHAADLDQSVEEPEAGFSSREQRLPVVTDEVYSRYVQRGVLDKHPGFPDLPDCPTEGLWGGYRAGYIPGQKGNCQDIALQAHGVAAHRVKPRLGFDVTSWDKLWKEDLGALKKKVLPAPAAETRPIDYQCTM